MEGKNKGEKRLKAIPITDTGKLIRDEDQLFCSELRDWTSNINYFDKHISWELAASITSKEDKLAILNKSPKMGIYSYVITN